MTYRPLLAAGAVLLGSAASGVERAQHVVAVWQPGCIETVTKTAQTQLEAPVDSKGVPDLHHARLVGVAVTYTKGCEVLEIRRD